MTKQELMETYTAEQLAEMVITAIQSKEDNEKLIEIITSAGKDLGKQIDEKRNEIENLQSEIEKYRKAFEDAKNERDCQIAEYQKKIEELEKKSDFYFPEEPIKVADIIIHGWETSWDYKNFELSELRQIAEHLLVYCNHNGEAEE